MMFYLFYSKWVKWMSEWIPGFCNFYYKLIKAQPHFKAKGATLIFSFVAKSFKVSTFSINKNTTRLACLNLQNLPFAMSSITSHYLTFLFLKILRQCTLLKCVKYLSQFSKPSSANHNLQIEIFTNLSQTFSSIKFLVSFWVLGKPK